jgi:hypothetical protein
VNYAKGDRVHVGPAYHSAPDLRPNGGHYVPDGYEGAYYVARIAPSGDLYLASDSRDAARGDWDVCVYHTRVTK